MNNAIAHVYANCQAHPNQGLVNALNHLIANLARHQAHDASKQSTSHGQDHSQRGHSQYAAHGKSGAAPGHTKHGNNG